MGKTFSGSYKLVRHMIQRIYKLLTKPNLDIGAFPMAQQVKDPPAMQEAQEMQV